MIKREKDIETEAVGDRKTETQRERRRKMEKE